MAAPTDKRQMAPRALERFLRVAPPDLAENAATVYITPATPRDTIISRLAGLMAPESAGKVGELAEGSETGAVLLWSPPQGHLVLPPFPVSADGVYPGWNAGPLVDLLGQEPFVGVLLLRLGRYAVGVYRGRALVASKTGARYVKGRHHAGGTSQKRFARVREKQAAELFKEVCGVLQGRLEPYEERLEHLFLGGERLTLQAFRRGCPYLERFEGRVRRRILPVGQPSLKALEALPREIWSSQVYTLD